MMWAALLLMLCRVDRQRYVPIEDQLVIDHSIPVDCTISDNPFRDLGFCPDSL
jgi:hypothetical protein